MSLVNRFKLYGLVYGFLLGFIISLLFSTYGHTPETLPIMDVLYTSCIFGFILGITSWLYLVLIKGDAVSGNTSGGSSDYDGGGDSGGGGD